MVQVSVEVNGIHENARVFDTDSWSSGGGLTACLGVVDSAQQLYKRSLSNGGMDGGEGAW